MPMITKNAGNKRKCNEQPINAMNNRLMPSITNYCNYSSAFFNFRKQSMSCRKHDMDILVFSDYMIYKKINNKNKNRDGW